MVSQVEVQRLPDNCCHRLSAFFGKSLQFGHELVREIKVSPAHVVRVVCGWGGGFHGWDYRVCWVGCVFFVYVGIFGFCSMGD